MKMFCSFTRLFAKLPQPGGRKVIFFWSSSQSATCLGLDTHLFIKVPWPQGRRQKIFPVKEVNEKKT